nr:hypothetical protein [Tanacetum cinerariifolium]
MEKKVSQEKDFETCYTMNTFDELNKIQGSRTHNFKSTELKDVKCGYNEDAHGMFDVGFETKMAAEAMEALLYVPPLTIDDNEQFLFPSRANCNSQAGGMNLKQKKVDLGCQVVRLMAQAKTMMSL